MKKSEHLVQQLKTPDSSCANLSHLQSLLVDHILSFWFAQVFAVNRQQQIINQILALPNLHQLYNIFHVLLSNIKRVWFLLGLFIVFIQVFEGILSSALGLELLTDSNQHMKEVLLIE